MVHFELFILIHFHCTSAKHFFVYLLTRGRPSRLLWTMVSLSFANITKEEILRQLAHWDDNKSHELIIVSTVFFVLSLIFVCLRFVARQKTRIRYRAEDYIIVISLVCFSKMNI